MNELEYRKRFQDVCKKARLVGASIVAVKDDEIVNLDNYGYQSLETKEEATSDTIYRIASISKTVGAISLMQLYEQGKIDINEDISKYFGFKIRNPKFVDDVITVKMLLLQTSSITDGYDDENPIYDNIVKGYNGVNGTNLDIKLEDLLVNTESEYYTPLTFSNYKPGTNFIYSNFGCGLMACLVEICSGEYYTDYMEKHIFKPLGIDASFKAKNIVDKAKIADLYYTDPDGKNYRLAISAKRFYEGGYKLFPLGSNFRGPAGGLFISMKNLSTIMRMFLNAGVVDGIRLLKKETVDLMYQQHWFGNGDDGGYHAKGLQTKVMDTFRDFIFRGHTGGAYGVRSYMFYNRKYQLGACFITNGGYYKTNEHKILDVFYETLDELIKDYKGDDIPSTFRITIDSNKAMVDDREIILDFGAFEKNGEVFIPAISLGDGLGIVASHFEEENKVIYRKNGKEIEYVNLDEINGVLVVPVLKTLKALNVEYEFDKLNNKLYIKYNS